MAAGGAEGGAVGGHTRIERGGAQGGAAVLEGDSASGCAGADGSSQHGRLVLPDGVGGRCQHRRGAGQCHGFTQSRRGAGGVG